MPGNVKTITDTLDYFPSSLHSAYAVTHTRHAVISEYPDGSSQRHSDVETSRRSWRFSKRLTASELSALRDFYFAHVGKPFLFKDLHSGQHVKAVFTSSWSETYDLGRFTVSLETAEVY